MGRQGVQLVDDVLDGDIGERGRRKGAGDKGVHGTAGRSRAACGVEGVAGGRAWEGAPCEMGALVGVGASVGEPYSLRIGGQHTIAGALLEHGRAFVLFSAVTGSARELGMESAIRRLGRRKRARTIGKGERGQPAHEADETKDES